MALYQQELFGPILILIQTSDYPEAMRLIAQNPYGNGAVIFTQNGKTAEKFMQEAQAGMIGINIPIPVPIVSHPFGGWKQSSFGAHGMHGEESLHFYTKHKSVTVTWPENNQGLSLNMPHL
jgi:malonate-semialdehyde dehydrogenase (acetylating)/methylmalonate-semialdehyde dehydrogenase